MSFNKTFICKFIVSKSHNFIEKQRLLAFYQSTNGTLAIGKTVKYKAEVVALDQFLWLLLSAC